ncbi:hypothetical protein [Occallatibacter riparius]|uniref:Uncharacterized protein n=1 Tax=Occallatibacter riparius TaxID=1002689 RepID=A0A9J7BJR3_9BACT|nr:hypothetical protein [Occallatibacter riparius]UWZ82779.1 hypothetical protein MOP44_19670 [Occallatibacter riparius]
MLDTYDEIASQILISDAELALTFVHLGNIHSDEESRRASFSRASEAYHSIGESMCRIRLKKHDLEKLGLLLQELRHKLDRARSTQ